MWKTCSENLHENRLFSPSKAAELYQNPCQLRALLTKLKFPFFLMTLKVFLEIEKAEQLKCVSSLHSEVHERL